MLYQVIVSAVLLSTLAPEPVVLQPQIEADDEEECAEKLEKWLQDTGYKMVEGSTVSFSEVPPVLEPESEEEAAARAPVADDTLEDVGSLAQRLSTMKNPDLRKLAEERGVNIEGLRSNADIANAILAAAADDGEDDGSSPES